MTETIAFIALLIAAVILEMDNREVEGLWFLIVMWVLFGFNN